MAYWQDVRADAWSRTKRGLWSDYRRITSIIIPIASAIIFAILLALFHMSYPITAAMVLASGVAGYFVAVLVEFIFHFSRIPPERDSESAKTIKAKDAEIDRLNGIMRGPEPPRPQMAIQVGHLFRLLRQVTRHGHNQLWLSELFALGKEAFPDFIPLPGQVDYPAALEELYKQDKRQVQIIETKEHPYLDFYGKRFEKDIRFIIGAVT